MEIDEIRFWKKVHKTETCWLWVGAIKTDIRYGVKYIKLKPIYAHRYSYELHFGPIPKGLCVCHKCDVRHCVNPEHLFLGTISDNIRDCVSKNRNAKGRMYARTILNEKQVKEIREKTKTGTSSIDLAKEYGCSRQNINCVTAFRTWKHI